ncbi:MAG: 2-oxoacid:ferredoxin oxidoreductase subunit beta [Planctomycetes bacterium]|nr:2-oxoacid:ferredoxin oxidoreductase subunit beta [Planctomycetota bacterium]
MNAPVDLPTLKPKDFKSDQEVRWCPGCGDYSILSQVQKVMPNIGVAKEDLVFVSGIGCSSRFPYYMGTYGFHSIHGRAPAIATGVKVANPELDVWVVTGDGDGLSIGGNHLLHTIRRNVGMNILLFNNRIYGLTKGQYSPTSEFGKKTKSSPFGSLDHPIHPISVAVGAEVTFVARTVDVDVKHLQQVLTRAAAHKGTAFVEIYQNCNVYNHNAFEYASDRQTKADHILYLEHGKPMIFGKDSDKGIRLNGTQPEVVQLGKGITEDDLLIHDEKANEPTLAYLLSRMSHPDFPEPMGVFRAISEPTYEDLVMDQITQATRDLGEGDLDALFNDGDTWTVE